MTPPSSTRLAVSIACPFTRVPFAEPRSSTTTVVPSTRTVAWRRETSGSGGERSPPSPRPTVNEPAIGWAMPLALSPSRIRKAAAIGRECRSPALGSAAARVEPDIGAAASTGLAMKRVPTGVSVVVGVAQPAADLIPADACAQLPDLAVPWPSPRPLALADVDRVGPLVDRRLPAGQHEV